MRFQRTALGVLGVVLAACGSDAVSTASDTTTASSTSSGTTGSGALPGFYSHFSERVTVTLSGSDVMLRSNGLPPHQSPYWGVGHALYIAPQAGMVVNPNRIQEQDLVLRVPAKPAVTTASSTPLGTIGITITGVSLFNQYAAGFTPLDAEIRTFDLYNGHPQGSGLYHHHLEPLAITQNDRTALVGVLLDGFPVYGPLEMDGQAPRDLDECNGHVRPTADAPAGLYHYHITAAYPYISGCFRGTAGRATS